MLLHARTCCNHGNRAKAILVSAQRRSHQDVPAAAESTVSAQHDTLAQLVARKDLMSLSNTHLQGTAANGGVSESACTSVSMTWVGVCHTFMTGSMSMSTT